MSQQVETEESEQTKKLEHLVQMEENQQIKELENSVETENEKDQLITENELVDNIKEKNGIEKVDENTLFTSSIENSNLEAKLRENDEQTEMENYTKNGENLGKFKVKESEIQPNLSEKEVIENKIHDKNDIENTKLLKKSEKTVFKTNIEKNDQKKETKLFKSNFSTAKNNKNKNSNKYKRPKINNIYKPKSSTRYKQPNFNTMFINWNSILEKCDVSVAKLKLLCDSIGALAISSYLSKKLSNCLHARILLKKQLLTHNFVDLTRKILNFNGINLGSESGGSKSHQMANFPGSVYHRPKWLPAFLTGKQ